MQIRNALHERAAGLPKLDLSFETHSLPQATHHLSPIDSSRNNFMMTDLNMHAGSEYKKK